MRCWLRLWLASAAVAAFLPSGCQHAEMGSPDSSNFEGLQGGTVPASYRVRPAEDASRLFSPLCPQTPARKRHAAPVEPESGAVELLPARHVESEGLTSAAGRNDWQLAGIAPAEPMLVSLAPPRSTRCGIREPIRPLYVEPPRPPSFAHAADFSWMVGILVEGKDADSWAVRYASVGNPGPYGGKLDLVNTGPMNGFQPGYSVRVEGELVDPAPFEVTPAYRVRAIQQLKRY